MSQKYRVFVVAHSEEFVILACTVLMQQQGEKDTRTHGRTSLR